MGQMLCNSTQICQNGMVPPILNEDGAVNRGLRRGIEFDARGEFVGIGDGGLSDIPSPRLSCRHFRTRRPGGNPSHREAF